MDDEKDSREAVAKFLTRLGHQVRECGDGKEALKVFSTDYFPLVLSDIKMPKMTGLELLDAISALEKETDIVLFTGHGDMDSAIAALRAGAYDYLLKPINIEDLATIIEKIACRRALQIENNRLAELFGEDEETTTEETQQGLVLLKKIAVQCMGLGPIGIFSKKMKEIFLQTQKYHYDRSIPVLIQGETGTGKEMVARATHFGDNQSNTPFIDLNCAAINPTLFESELFGYEAGSFTGGLAKGQKGKIDLALGGTLFLDEIGELPLELQSKLLRVIQEKEFYRVGGLKKIKTDIRIICATNVDLEKQVEEGRFRRDLYYRLKVGHILIPPLRQRQEDILPLALLFLQKFSQEKKKKFRGISTEAGRILLTYNWPGNIRELRNAIEWSVFMYDDLELLPKHLNILEEQECKEVEEEPFLQELPPNGFDLEDYIDRIVLQVLEICKGNKTEAANYLGISRRSFCYRLEKIEK